MNRETDTLLGVKHAASGNLLSDTGSPARGLCDDPEGWDGGGEVGGRSKREDVHVRVADSFHGTAETIAML